MINTFTKTNTLWNQEDTRIEFADVFDNKLGRIQGKYKINLEENYVPVKHCQITVAAPLQEKVKQKLEELEKNDIIEFIREPTEWILSMVVVRKKNDDIRIFLDPKDLNQVIQREHYPLPVIDELAPRLNNAKYFTVLDVKNGFRHIDLEKKSRKLTTFNTPYGRYVWKRLTFGICSAPEVFQKRIKEIIEGLEGVEVIADDFLIIGYGENDQEEASNHDNNLKAFLRTCRKNNLKLNWKCKKNSVRIKKYRYINRNT